MLSMLLPRRKPALAAAFSLLVTTVPLWAGPPDDTFLRDYAETRGFMLGRPVSATPAPDGKTVLFLRAKSAREPSQELYEFEVASGQTRRLLAPEDALKGAVEKLSAEEKARRERQRISVGGFTAFSISENSALVLLSLSGKPYVLDRAGGGVIELATGAGAVVDPKFSPDSRSVAYVRDQDVFVLDLATNQERAVTTGGTETISHGLAEFVAQEEMARFSGYWWSPDSRQIVYQESDAAEVESWYVADPSQPGNPPGRTFYPRPGKANVTVRLCVATLDNPGKSVWLDYDRSAYPYLGKVTWKKEGPLTLTVLSRDQRDLALLKADPDTGKTSVLLTEHNDAWVNLGQDVPVWLSEKDGGGFLWADESRAWRDLERRDAAGHPAGVLTGNWEDNFRMLAGVAGGRAFGIFSYREPFYALPSSIPLDGKPSDQEYAKLMPEPGLAQMTFGDCETIFTEREQTLTTMPHTVVRRVSDGALLGELPSVAGEPPFRPPY